jgi:hypothetical protein
MPAGKTYRLRDAANREYESGRPGALGGYAPRKIYGRLDCSSALRFLAKGHYADGRVFFRDEETAVSAGYRPCGVCMKDKYAEWRARNAP